MPDTTRLREAELIIDAMNRVMDLDEATPRQRVEGLLRTLQQMVGHDADCELVLQTTASDPAAVPQIVERVFVGPTFDRIEPRPDSAVQDAFNASQPALQKIVSRSREQLRVPHTYVIGRDPNASVWFESMYERFMKPHGWADLIMASWASSERRMVSILVIRRDDMPEITDEQVQVTSLMLRAVAPMIDREMFDGIEAEAAPTAALLAGRDLSRRQRDVLHQLLRGMSEKEVARELGVSPHTVHTHVKRLYTEFNVTSRGELLALFVDQRALREGMSSP